MKRQWKQYWKKAAAFALVIVMTVGFAGCGGGGGQDIPTDANGKTVIYFAPSHVSAQKQDAYKELVQTYNETQGEKDGIYVQMNVTSGALTQLESALRGNYQNDVIQLNDDEFKTLALQGKDYFLKLDDYLTDDVKTAMSWNEIADSLVNRFRLNTTPGSDGKCLAGAGANLLALPVANDPQVLFYNKSILETCGINIVSVPQADLEAYNTENKAALQPHGYAEYKDAPYEGAKSSRNEAGEFVYKVFNECIAMNWEELRCLSRAFQKQYSYEYGYMSEWWFNYGFSVGGDCVGWDTASNSYKFTLTDKQPGYLALTDVTVNGSAYSKGDVLRYEDKSFLNNNASELKALEGKVYTLPSQYDAILEFTRLGVPANKEVETGVNGYGIAPSTTANRTQRFTSGKDCPLLIEYFSQAQSFKGILGDALGMTMPAQYREFVGGSTYEKDGTEYLKVIGETYDGEVYTGELHYEGETAIVGEAATASEAAGLFLPANTKNKNYDAAFKFASWVAGIEGQKILAKSNTSVPNQSSYGLGKYGKEADRLMGNMWAGAYMAQEADIGDYTYFTSLTWIPEWSMAFNGDVRGGNLTISEFIAQKQEVADTSLKGMRLHINGR